MDNSLAQIRTVYVDELKGTPGFGRRLVEALEQIGRFTFTSERAGADAIVQADGQDSDEAFVGELVIRDQHNTVLWSGRALRPYGQAGPMAYEQLIEQLLHALDGQSTVETKR